MKKININGELFYTTFTQKHGDMLVINDFQREETKYFFIEGDQTRGSIYTAIIEAIVRYNHYTNKAVGIYLNIPYSVHGFVYKWMEENEVDLEIIFNHGEQRNIKDENKCLEKIIINRVFGDSCYIEGKSVLIRALASDMCKYFIENYGE